MQEFSLHGIKDAESVNKFMKKYIARFNRKFSVVPKGAPVFRKPGKNINLDYILCSKISRKLDGGSAFSYRGKYYQLLSGGKPAATIPRSGIIVLTSSKIGIKARYSGKVYSVARLEERPKVARDTRVKTRLLAKKPAASHP